LGLNKLLTTAVLEGPRVVKDAHG